MESDLLLETGPFRKIVICPSGTSKADRTLAVSLSSIGQAGKATTACKVDLVSTATLNVSLYERLIERPIFGCLGIIRVDSGTVHYCLQLIQRGLYMYNHQRDGNRECGWKNAL
jgi:hypothetical protein